ncbi:uncharacterized protein CANTADRAFT_27081 [Suhomyces tanzawaensis NRRL Y-17324]|uniref:Uncharacterized protein n=1 Tax=Suhomyces tanzawaensis NRRL Y-17324 TaxID=984487 RepID=A0A1E4SF80_9ASCO|nr:uncharacterized protein CANTADRAFT_27081 [Suhomyces tanzawaensis NRRL Y-17324]ODV78177.1 hypothetical protein CANTADRAFT_27081 [Suhomyces tanzawaensis NRRL Y-17324]
MSKQSEPQQKNLSIESSCPWHENSAISVCGKEQENTGASNGRMDVTALYKM